MIANIIACNQVTHNSSAIIAVCMNQQCKQNAAACVECLTSIHSHHSKECYSLDKINQTITIINKEYDHKVYQPFKQLEADILKWLQVLEKTLVQFGRRFDSIYNLTDLNKLRKQLCDYENIINFYSILEDALINSTLSIKSCFDNTISLITQTYEVEQKPVNPIRCPLCLTTDPQIAELIFGNSAIRCRNCDNLHICLNCRNQFDFQVGDHINPNGQFRCRYQQIT